MKILLKSETLLRLNSVKTYRVIYYILNNKTFQQNEISEKADISLGQVNKVVKWLIETGIVMREESAYKIVQPNRLIELLSLYGKTQKFMTYQVNLSKDSAVKLLKANSGVLCLSSSLEKYGKEIKNEEIFIYHDQKILDELNKLPRGNLKINVYKPGIPIALEEETKNNMTCKVRTLIDLYSSGQQDLTKNLSMQLWGTLQ